MMKLRYFLIVYSFETMEQLLLIHHQVIQDNDIWTISGSTFLPPLVLVTFCFAKRKSK